MVKKSFLIKLNVNEYKVADNVLSKSWKLIIGSLRDS